MKKEVLVLIIGIMLCFPLGVEAQRGCCSHHGGVASCDPSGKYRCVDGTLSPSCTCSGGSSSSSSTYNLPTPVYGCTDSTALNYNPNATADDGSCIAKIEGCTDTAAINYNQAANFENGSCHYQATSEETEVIKFEKEYKKNEAMTDGEEKITTEGKNGEKVVNYTIITDKDGNIISKEKVSEKVTKEPVTEIIEKGTKTEQDGVGLVSTLWIICTGLVLIYKSNHKEENLLITKISMQSNIKKVLLYICYFIFVIPVFIDTILIIINKIKNKQS